MPRPVMSPAEQKAHKKSRTKRTMTFVVTEMEYETLSEMSDELGASRQRIVYGLMKAALAASLAPVLPVKESGPDELKARIAELEAALAAKAA